jgi:hypothetical protein
MPRLKTTESQSQSGSLDSDCHWGLIPFHRSLRERLTAHTTDQSDLRSDVTRQWHVYQDTSLLDWNDTIADGELLPGAVDVLARGADALHHAGFNAGRADEYRAAQAEAAGGDAARHIR